jgi:hypothetical protein
MTLVAKPASVSACAMVAAVVAVTLVASSSAAALEAAIAASVSATANTYNTNHNLTLKNAFCTLRPLSSGAFMVVAMKIKRETGAHYYFMQCQYCPRNGR